MADVVQAFEAQLLRWRRRYAGRPGREMVKLCLLSLEREEIVAIAYREDALGKRLARMPVADDVREIAGHALLWAWKDEEMHAIYVRGCLLRLGSPWLRLRALQHQAAGAVGGWASSVRQHVRWSDAPLSRLIATLLTWAGLITGRVPREVRRFLDCRAFRDFCLFNAQAERTARLCWERLAELAAEVPAISRGLVEEFQRVAEDEERHERVFSILAAALDAEDRLVAGESASTLANKIGAVGEFFLPRRRRTGRSARNPLGSGAPVWCVSGSARDDKRTELRRLLEASGLERHVGERARERGIAVSALRVAIKPTFMLGYHQRDRSIITDPELLDELAAFLRELGCADVAAVECANIYDNFYRNRTVDQVARYMGLGSRHYRIVDSANEQVPHRYFRGMAQYSVGRTWKEADYRISFAKMRSHPVELVYLTVPNVEWVGGRCDQFLFLDRQAHRETAIMMLLDEFPPDYALLDGYELAADGLVGVMGCASPPRPRRLYAGADALAVDMVAARHLGLRDPRESTILRAALHWFGSPSGPSAPVPARPEVIGCDEPVAGWRSPYHDELSTFLSFLAYPVYVLGSGRGALFVPEMDLEAFPLLEPEGLVLRSSRRAVRTLLGLRLPAAPRTPSDVPPAHS
jgi:uncharacterized protein (DUF362 family)